MSYNDTCSYTEIQCLIPREYPVESASVLHILPKLLALSILKQSVQFQNPNGKMVKCNDY